MLIWAHEGITGAAANILIAAGHSVETDPGWYPWVFKSGTQRRTLFALWTRLSPSWGPWHPGVVAWKPEIIATPCTDSTHCDEARKRGVKVLSLRDCGDLSEIRATVEFTIAAILALTRKLPAAVESVRSGDWDRMEYQGMDIYGKTAAIIGCGRIGGAVASHLRHLGMEIVIHDALFSYSRPLLTCLEIADLVTVHADLNDTSRSMFGREQFAAMKPGAYFVNTARGAIVDEAALLDALRSGHLAGAALDVLCREPPQALNEPSHRYLFHPLVEFARENPERLIITPHIGGCTVESLEKAEVLLARKLVEVLADG